MEPKCYQLKDSVMALQYSDTNMRGMYDFLTNYKKTYQYMTSSEDGIFYINWSENPNGGLILYQTLCRTQKVRFGDYVVRESDNKFRVYSEKEFKELFQLIEGGNNNETNSND